MLLSCINIFEIKKIKKNKNKIGKNNFSKGCGECLTIAMSTDACWVEYFVLNRAVLCRAGYFCVEACTSLLNRAFLYQTRVLIGSNSRLAEYA